MRGREGLGISLGLGIKLGAMDKAKGLGLWIRLVCGHGRDHYP